ncbi:MAG TPA: DUF1269 domain-containing protein [Roseiflexaceae bacterium]|nr:DUF1269 domain-containing protein [Roseiflexaceae bacterium]
MSDRTQLIVYTFEGDERAEEARAALHALSERSETVKRANIAVVARHADGRIDFWETAEADEIRRDADLGSVAGWLLGAIGAVLGAPLGPRFGIDAGAGLGREAAERVDVGFRDEDLRRFGEQLVAGSSALIALVREADVPAVVAELETLGGTLAQTSLPPETVARLRARRQR